MKLSSWLNRLSSRRQVRRPVLVAEIFEPRTLMDATLPSLVAQTSEVEATSEEIVTFGSPENGEDPNLIFYSLGGALPQAPINQFGSREEFGDYLLNRALARYEGLFGQPEWWHRGPVYFRGGEFLAQADAPAAVPDHSETNVQVDGVDEGDVIENDGQNLFVLNGNDLVILQAYPAGEMRELSRVHFEGYAIAEYLDGNRLTVISQEYSYGRGAEIFEPRTLMDATLPSLVAQTSEVEATSEEDEVRGIGIMASRFAAPSSTTTVVSTFDVTDRSRPTLEKQTRLDGNYVDSRAFNGQVHAITSHDLSLPAPQTDGTTTIDVPVYFYDTPTILMDVIPTESVSIQSCDAMPVVDPSDRFAAETQQIEVPVYESRESYIARVREQLDSLIDKALPHYQSLTSSGFATSGVISEMSAIARVIDSESDSLLSVVSIDTRGGQPGLISSSSVVTDWTNGIHANRDHLYVFSPIYNDGGTQTRVVQFAWANGGREIQLLASGVVEGTLLNQFSADEHDGRLRIATTTSHYDADAGVFTQANNLTVLENINGTLTEVGAVNGFANGEQIYSARYDGDRAFVVTFRQVDPLFVFDLSDPTAPVIRGELKVPGTSSYLQLIDENHLLAIGRSFETQSTKVSLYDISDPTNPFEVDEDILPQWTWSQAEWDAKAIGWFASSNTLAIPTSGYDESFGYHNELVVFHIDVTQSGESAIQETGSVEDDGYIVRSAFIGEVLYAISSNSVIATNINSPDDILGQVDFAANATIATLTLEPVYSETDDGASDWQYLDLPDSLDEAEGMLALAAVNVLDGTVRVSLLDAEATVNATLRNNTLTLRERGHQTENVSLSTASSLVIEGTDLGDRLNLTIGRSRNSPLTSIVINAGAGEDRVQLLAVDQSFNAAITINGEDGNDQVVVAGAVRAGLQLNGGEGSDSLTGGRGNDTIDGGAGDDSMIGGRGNDVLIGRDGADAIFGNDGSDSLSGGAGHDRLNGGNDNDVLLGGDGNDKLYGGAGNDLALGEEGDDTVDGGAGSRDTLVGGSGRNRMVGRRQEIVAAFNYTADWLNFI